MINLLKYIVLFIFAVFVLYSMDVLEVPRNVFTFVFQFLLLLGGALLILHLFEKLNADKHGQS